MSVFDELKRGLGEEFKSFFSELSELYKFVAKELGIPVEQLGIEARKQILDSAINKRRKFHEVIIKVGRGQCLDELVSSLAKEFGFQLYCFSSIGYAAMQVPAVEAVEIRDRLCSKGFDARLAYNFFLPELLLSERFSKQELSSPNSFGHLEQIGAKEAQKVTKGEGTKVLVLDTGVDYNHKELCKLFAKPEKGYNFVHNSNDPFDDNGHGTHVTGLLAGLNTGVATLCDLYSAKVLNSYGYGSEVDIVRAIEWGINKKVNVMSMSIGSTLYSELEEEIIKEAVLRGILVFAASGNFGWGKSYPAAYQGVISVAAVDSENKHAEFSNIDESVDLSAPGVDILSSIPANRYAKYSGTSMSAPLAAGVGALLISLKPGLRPEYYEQLLKDSCLPLGAGEFFRKEKYGAGLVRADIAVGIAQTLSEEHSEVIGYKIFKKMIKLLVD